MRKTIILITILLLTGCHLPRNLHDSLSVPTSETPSTLTAGNPSQATIETPVYESCYFNWATQSLPELTSQVQAAMQAAGLASVQVIAEAYGENCYRGTDNQPVYFATLETDFRLTIPVKDLGNRDELGSLLEQILVVLDGFPVGSVPGPQPGYIGITFQGQEDELRLWFTVTEGISARAQGLTGQALLEELQ